jgi:multidrug transporter EmrE-like cation transporter
MNVLLASTSFLGISFEVNVKSLVPSPLHKFSRPHIMFQGLILLVTVLLTAGLNTLAQTLLKLGAGKDLFNLNLAGGLVAYGLSTILYITALGKLELSFAYPTIIGITLISTVTVSTLFLGEIVSPLQWLGTLAIMGGIVLIYLAKMSHG